MSATAGVITVTFAMSLTGFVAPGSIHKELEVITTSTDRSVVIPPAVL